MENTLEKFHEEYGPSETFIFFREGGVFYPVDIPASTIEDNVKCNPGTLRVEDLLGTVMWDKSKEIQG